jgi:hypothetical protein
MKIEVSAKALTQRLLRAIGIAVLGAASAAAAPATFKDCENCPVMTNVPGRPIAAAQREVTVAEFDAFLRSTQYHIGVNCRTFEEARWEERAPRDFRLPGFAQSANDPAVCLTWYDARAYVAWLNSGGARSGGYRLPTRAEWQALNAAAGGLKLEGLETGAAEWLGDCARISTHPAGVCVLRERAGRHWASGKGLGAPLPTAAPTVRDAATGVRVVKDLPAEKRQ